jgi:HEAT repeat protein
VFSGALFIAAAVVARSMLWNARPGARVLIGFERRAGRAGAHPHGDEVPVAAGALEAAFTAPPPPIPQPRAGHTYPELQPVFSSRDSVFAGGESVFALAEREADSRVEEFRPAAPQLWRSTEPTVPIEPTTEPAGSASESPTFVEGAEATVEEWIEDEVAAPAEGWISDDVERLASSFDPSDRLRAIDIALQSSSDPVVATIVKALGDPAAQVRRRAAVELGKLGAREAIPALDHAIEDPDESVRAAALEALSTMQIEDAPLHEDAIISAIVDALRDESPDVRRAAAAELLRRQSPDVVRMLGDALSSSTLREPALDVLSQMGSVAIDPIVDLLAAANGFRPALGAALARVAGPEHFVAELSMLDPTRRRRAVEALAALGQTHEVARALLDPEPEIRARGAELLGELGDDRARDDLERAVYDPVSEVCEAARGAIARLVGAAQFETV